MRAETQAETDKFFADMRRGYDQSQAELAALIADPSDSRFKIMDAREFLGGAPLTKEERAARQKPIAPRMSKHIGEVLTRRTEVNWLMRDEIERGVIAIMSGPRGSYKSSVSLNWIGRVCVQLREPVLWCTAEGSGTDRRFKAWLQKHAPDVDPLTLPLRVIERRYDFFKDNGDILKLSAELEAMNKEFGDKPALVVVDTYSKYNGGLRENENDDAKRFIGNLDKLRRPYGCTVLLITHTGLSDTGRARGASALEADSDAAYVVSHSSGVIRVTRQRFKDSAELPDMVLKPVVVDLGYCDVDGNPVTACVAEVATDSDAMRAAASIRPLGGNQKIMFEVLQQMAPRGQKLSIAAVIDEGMKRKGTDAGAARTNDGRRYLKEALSSQSLTVRGVRVRDDEVWIEGAVEMADEDWLDE